MSIEIHIDADSIRPENIVEEYRDDQINDFLDEVSQNKAHVIDHWFNENIGSFTSRLEVTKELVDSVFNELNDHQQQIFIQENICMSDWETLAHELEKNDFVVKKATEGFNEISNEEAWEQLKANGFLAKKMGEILYKEFQVKEEPKPKVLLPGHYDSCVILKEYLKEPDDLEKFGEPHLHILGMFDWGLPYLESITIMDEYEDHNVLTINPPTENQINFYCGRIGWNDALMNLDAQQFMITQDSIEHIGTIIEPKVA